MSALHDIEAIMPAVLDLPGSVVTRWVLVAEVLDEDGDQCLATRHSANLAEWDIHGLLGFAAERSKARIAEVATRPIDDDD
jgi:hypothetical protein